MAMSETFHLRLLGSIKVERNGIPLRGFESRKALALLSYLSVQDSPVPREHLLELFWEGLSESRGRANLSWVLNKISSLLPGCLDTDRHTVQFQLLDNYWLDLDAFEKLEAQREPASLAAAVKLFRGDFLEDLRLERCPEFENWALVEQERWRHRIALLLRDLVVHHSQRREYEEGLYFAQRLLALQPWREEIHRQAMYLLAWTGQRGAALAQYKSCQTTLLEELDVEPAAETKQLYELIRDGKLEPPAPLPNALLDLTNGSLFFLERDETVKSSVFVGRERELSLLDGFINAAIAGRGQVVFIIGGPGRGKTALMREFACHAQTTHTNLIVAGGKGNAFTGTGDPYLPFREVLSTLTSDVEAQWVEETMSREQIRRLWHLLPFAVRALVELGPDLIGTFLNGASLLARARAYAPTKPSWLIRLDKLVERKASFPQDPSLQQTALFQQYVQVLQALSKHRPLLLLLDDLQWADLGSIGLLYHLGQVLVGLPILILGAYRPEDVTLGRPSQDAGSWERHPLEALINEFQVRFKSSEMDLDRANDKHFVNALLDTEPNQLSTKFRDRLHQQTQGHPLFTIELLKEMQERGDLILDEKGRWGVGETLDWETLPPAVAAVIAERVERLDMSSQLALQIASVEGEVFTAEVLAQILEMHESEMVELLSGELSRQHRLVRAKGFRRINNRRLSHYQFRHILFQKYLYSHIDPIEQAYHHESVGRTLEMFYEGQTEALKAIAPQMARHFQRAGIVEKAIDYLYQAGDRALKMSAYKEAIDYLSEALALLASLPASLNNTQKELAIRLTLAMPLQSVKGYAAPEVGLLYKRMRELCNQVGETALLFPVLWLAHSYYTVRAKLQMAIEVAQHLINLAEHANDPVLVAMAHWALGWVHRCRGEFESARTHLEQVIDWYDPQRHHFLTFLYAQDPGVVCRSQLSIVLWMLGYPDQALRCSQEALALAQEVSHPFSIAFAQLVCASVYSFRLNAPMTQQMAENLIELSTEHGFSHWLALGNWFRGFALILQGQIDQGIRQALQGMADYQATGAALDYSLYLAGLIEGYKKAGRIETAISALAEDLAFIENTEERYGEALLYGLKGELLQMQSADEEEIEQCIWQGIEVARQQHAKSLELRVTITLCRLWQKQGKLKEARQLLTEIYNWFTEGFESGDLKQARALLQELS